MWNLSMYTKLVGKSLIHCPLVSFLEIPICVESLCQIKCRLEGCKNIPSHHWMNFAYLENFHKKFAGSCETSRNFSIHKAIKVQYSPPGFHRLNPMPHQLSNYSISLVAVWAYRHYYSPPSFFLLKFYFIYAAWKSINAHFSSDRIHQSAVQQPAIDVDGNLINNSYA